MGRRGARLLHRWPLSAGFTLSTIFGLRSCSFSAAVGSSGSISERAGRFDEAQLTADVLRIFIDGDCVFESFYPYMQTLANQSKLAVFVAVKGSQKIAQERLRRRLLESGIDESQLLLVPTRTGAENAADVVLTYLYGRYAGTRNYLVSDDRKWFEEVVRAEPWRITIWITSDRFRRL
ncbi:unnamed protein product [Symbiodinium sp. CCMP2592]|nr:unnamed protein product [Symbiodinium sp. CCMP2592]